jgi:hypothetical protein
VETNKRGRRLRLSNIPRRINPGERGGNAKRAGGEPLCRPASLLVFNRRLPGTAHRVHLALLAAARESQESMEAAGSFSGAAGWLPTKVAAYKAAPLRRGRRSRIVDGVPTGWQLAPNA